MPKNIYFVETGLRPVSANGININNILGKCVLSTLSANAANPQEGNIRIDISNLPSVLYYVRLGGWKGQFVKVE
ncbi:MAG: T9SS type A sorting domain-containing protein [Candidatus Kapabacteria bacterium]|nr:T9SS type A sorting domain-containing protein [Candidatus Kapabacteria bacterium]